MRSANGACCLGCLLVAQAHDVRDRLAQPVGELVLGASAASEKHLAWGAPVTRPDELAVGRAAVDAAPS